MSPGLTIVAESSRLLLPPVKAGLHLVSASRGVRAVRSGRRSRAGDRLAASQLPGPGRGPDDDEPAAADIPAIDADVDAGELIAAQQPQVLLMHNAGDSSQVGSCSHEPPRRDQYLSGGQEAHHDSMGRCGAR
jgi:hypothetical protein